MADDSRKRSHDDLDKIDHANGEQQDESSSDDDLGPALPSAAPPKKKRKLPHEKLYIAALPKGKRYSKSLMHKEQLAFVRFTGATDFLVTASVEGTVKFWKKDGENVEFVKEFKAHDGQVTSISVSNDGRSLATGGADGTIKIFDVVSFDLLSMLELDAPARSICWVHGRGSTLPLLAVAREGKQDVQIFDGRAERGEPLDVVAGLHRSPVHLLAYNITYDCVVSVDEGGMVEYWSATAVNHEKPEGLFEFKSATNLFEFKKAKSVPSSLAVSPTGAHFATFSFPDRKVRVFEFATGKLHRTYDESLPTLTEMQQAGTALQRLEDLEFGRRMAVERELENAATLPKIDLAFDESGHFLLYGSLLGVKAINTRTNRVVRVYGADEPFRALGLALHQGGPPKIRSADVAASTNPLLEAADERAPLLVATGVGKIRFYIFSDETDVSRSTRDVQNEKPKQLASENLAQQRRGESGSHATLHTTFGDIALRLFPEAAPKTVENFATHAKKGYYDGTIFHRIIKKFMIQGGDPLGDGTGGESIWGKEFEDEFSDLKHDKPYTLSMANAGPNTNASQFFITTVKTPWLDGKHTVFGRVTAGMDVVHRIENVRTHKEKPEEDIKVVSISIA